MKAELLPNGLVRVESPSGLWGLFNQDGERVAGAFNVEVDPDVQEAISSAVKTADMTTNPNTENTSPRVKTLKVHEEKSIVAALAVLASLGRCVGDADAKRLAAELADFIALRTQTPDE